MYSSEMQVRVRYAETDQMNVVYHGNYAQYFEVGRVESLRQLGLSYKELEATGVIMPVIEWTAKFLRPAHYDDLLTVKTSLRELPAGHRIEFHQEVYNESGRLLTTGKVVLYFLRRANMEKTNMPEEMKERLAPYFIPGGDQPSTV
ncbi:MAG: thioesterase family protein [Bacteroidota bacterium]|nr:thioesterase family protein [Bacteroidota bacterium]MDP4218489.1 thioesterase family protein [Bacteroidota bacterium]MDP4247593.1 thioesterase family protein [Bacteroidota bacterium]MDP4255148.1 thioesterase family protein [Bacteroidota bacterium]MDP4260184.1 thioesterase family protein [Bacteroidota bacterium]